jgi:hypothetical protein
MKLSVAGCGAVDLKLISAGQMSPGYNANGQYSPTIDFRLDYLGVVASY